MNPNYRNQKNEQHEVLTRSTECCKTQYKNGWSLACDGEWNSLLSGIQLQEKNIEICSHTDIEVWLNPNFHSTNFVDKSI